ncbi:hypothetical protein ACFWR4_25975 [Streptomyces hydrogenans]|uniref:hypothetical protein n=1 Tax=Streptomyces hydrogenans TaxID=1873719 RepID=UPI0036611CD2
MPRKGHRFREGVRERADRLSAQPLPVDADLLHGLRPPGGTDDLDGLRIGVRDGHGHVGADLLGLR